MSTTERLKQITDALNLSRVAIDESKEGFTSGLYELHEAVVKLRDVVEETVTGRVKIEKTQLQRAASGFDLFRLTKGKVEVGLSPNTLRAYNRQGLAFYRQGKCVFISKIELDEFIRKNK